MKKCRKGRELFWGFWLFLITLYRPTKSYVPYLIYHNMTFQYPSVVGGLASALKSSQSDANSNSPTNGEVLDILRSSIPRDYLVSYKAAEELRVISTAVKSINIQSRVCNSIFTTAKNALRELSMQIARSSRAMVPSLLLWL